jgi:hypothetical protein
MVRATFLVTVEISGDANQGLDIIKQEIADLNRGRAPLGISTHSCGGRGPDGMPIATDLRYTANANTLEIIR